MSWCKYSDLRSDTLTHVERPQYMVAMVSFVIYMAKLGSSQDFFLPLAL